MCVNKRYITNKYTGQKVLVNCGHCPACLQEKAIARTNRIRAEYTSKTIALFVTLTYRNDKIPYFHLEQFLRDGVFRVVRDKRVRYVRVRGNKWKPREYAKADWLATYDVLSSKTRTVPFDTKFLKGQDDMKIGVAYYPDFQLFMKRLRQNLERNYDFTQHFSYYSCSEYGPKTLRPHFHLLLFVPSGSYKTFASAIAKSWSFDDYFRTRRNIEVAVDASSYVASYVNCDSTLPTLFREKNFRPKHSYSKGFGVQFEHYKLDKVLEKIRRGNLGIDMQRVQNGVLTTSNILIPKYVIHRYFPKFKGYSRLNGHALYNVLTRPESLSGYAFSLGIDNDQYHAITVAIHNKHTLFRSIGLTPHDYALYHYKAWKLYYSELYKRSFDDVHSLLDYFQLYDNIGDYFAGNVVSDSMDEVLEKVPLANFEVNYNLFEKNVAKTRSLEDAYHRYSKDRKLRNSIYSETSDFHV